ncbi:unnamed protein product [Hydatigera taeniaeformis]|uniref:Conserved oligomeric Golgi complex subunit 1 n=1 Tax=Hydatigena taeniaeformis TaxID=6205 RepID=A0A0R3WYG7_HYDTA|nr:unnamed protein product [Hydatigera taeniaeformis]
MEASVNEMFEKYTVDEIRLICMEMRNDIESKKMELRFLVGERHRDVIEASDNILHMNEFSHSITEKLEQLEKCCAYESLALANSSRLKHRLSGNPKWLIASQLKLLLDIPEMVWSALDEMNYTGAVEYFLLGRYLSIKMRLTGEAAATHVNPRVLVKRQWAALDDIENTIASACRKQLAFPTVSDDVSLSPLIVYYLVVFLL